MRKHCSDVCKLRPCLNKESQNSARLRTIVTAALQRQYSQTELIFWISLVHTLSPDCMVSHPKENDIYSHCPESLKSHIFFMTSSMLVDNCCFRKLLTVPNYILFSW